MRISKNKRRYRLIVKSAHDYGSESFYTFYDADAYDIYDEYCYRGNALDLRENGGMLKPGDMIELDAYREVPARKYYDLDLKARVRRTWLYRPSKMALKTEI